MSLALRRLLAAVSVVVVFAACPAKSCAPPVAPERAPTKPYLRWIEGRVLAHGKPVAGLELTWQPFFLDGNPPPEWAAIPPSPPPTDAEGRFAFEAPRVAAVFLGTGNPEGTAARVLQPNGPWNQTTLELREDGALEVRVAGPQGEPVPNAEVRVAQGVMEMQTAMRGLLAASANALGGEDVALDETMPPLGEAAKPGAPGVWLAPKVYAGVWHVLVRAPGYQRAQMRTRVEHGARKVVKVVLAAGVKVEGRLANAGKAQVFLSPATRREPVLPSDPEELIYEVALMNAGALRGIEDPEEQQQKATDGVFTFDELAPGDYRLTVSSEGFLEDERKVTAPASGLRIALEPLEDAREPRKGSQ